LISSLIFLLGVAALGFLACRFRAWLILLALPLDLYLAYSLLSELYGPSIYDSLLIDFGYSIVVYHYLVAAILVSSPVIGAILSARRKHKFR
jgi:hypothetical protein